MPEEVSPAFLSMAEVKVEEDDEEEDNSEINKHYVVAKDREVDPNVRHDYLEEDEGDASRDDLASGQGSIPSPATCLTPPRPKKRARTADCSADPERLMRDYFHKAAYIKVPPSPFTPPTEEDDLEKFLMSMACTIRRLPVRTQADLKFKIHQLIYQAEMEALYPETPSSSNM